MMAGIAAPPTPPAGSDAATIASIEMEPKRRRLTKTTTPAGPAPLNFIIARKSIIMAKLKKHTGFVKMRDYYEARRTEMLRHDFPNQSSTQRRDAVREEWARMTDQDKRSWTHRERSLQ